MYETRDQCPKLQTAFYEVTEVERGEVALPALGPADWVGKRPYRSEPTGEIVYLFDDEVLT